MNHTSIPRATFRKSGLVAGVAAAAAMVAVGVPLALAAPTAAPPSDGQGYVDSTARCTKPDTAVIFGTTDSSRVAICQTAAGGFQYRGVRVSDGAKLVVAATRTSSGTSGDTFVATNDGATYTITPQALSVTVGGDTIRTESWTDYHGPQAPASTSGTAKSATSTTATPSTSGTAAPTTSGAAAPKTSAAAPSTSAAPLPPPLPAEVGGGTSSTR